MDIWLITIKLLYIYPAYFRYANIIIILPAIKFMH
nr:MAG TPA: hypothetical protein [Caudoviricetes sp.]